MDIVYQNQTGTFVQGKLDQHPTMTGYFIVTTVNGLQFSMQPGGVDGERDTSKGQGNGPWEACKRTGNILCWTTGDGHESYIRGMAER